MLHFRKGSKDNASQITKEEREKENEGGLIVVRSQVERVDKSSELLGLGA